MSKTISISSPTRVDLSGGTLDCWPIYLFIENCVTVNLSIDIFTKVELTPLASQEIKISIEDFKYEKTFSSLEEFLSSKDSQVLLLQKILKYFKPSKGFALKTSSESPVGGGLGGSSSLCISLIQAFEKWQELSLSFSEKVRLASSLEAQVLQKPTGTQDYIPALKPGLNGIYYSVEGFRVESFAFPKELFSSLFLVDTGVAHHSGINNWQVIKSLIDGDKKTRKQLEVLRDISLEMVQSCKEENWEKVPRLFDKEFQARCELSPSFTSPEIESIKKIVLQEEKSFVKICGAGGGGCLAVWARPENMQSLQKKCQKEGFPVLQIHPSL